MEKRQEKLTWSKNTNVHFTNFATITIFKRPTQSANIYKWYKICYLGCTKNFVTKVCV